MFIRSTVEFRL